MGTCFQELPEECVANILSLTSPRDACRLSPVSSTFRSAAESDAVWEKFLPRDYHTVICPSTSSSSSPVSFSSKKELYLRLCDNPVLIDQGKRSFSLDKWSGKKCYMLSARDLMIMWGGSPNYWRWTSQPSSRFAEVAVLRKVDWLEICGKINTFMLSPATLYKAYLVFKSTPGSYGFENQPVDVDVGLVGTESCQRSVYLDAERGRRRQYQIVPRRMGRFSRVLGLQASVPRENDSQYPKQRGDGWLEIELGEFFNLGKEDEELQMSVLEVKTLKWKSGLVVQGIEIRPKEDIMRSNLSIIYFLSYPVFALISKCVC